jgi:hypothetical protein
MDLPFEVGKGTAEQLLNVKSPIHMRVALPGALATAALYPTTAWLLEKLPRQPEYVWQRIVAYLALAFLLGGLVSLLSDEIYKIYEGRTLWPDWLRDLAIDRQQSRILKLRKRADEAFVAGDRNRYNELWDQIGQYPMNEESGEAEAQRPTRLGNILAAYEQYPLTRYGMAAVFYWPRIWLQVEKEKKEDIDAGWSIADGFLSLSAVSLTGGVLWIAEAAGKTVGVLGNLPIPFHSAGWSALAALAWWLCGYACYRISLPSHRQNGEIFKSIFDLYRSKVWDLTSLKPQEEAAWKAAWSYLQYLMFVCPVCGRMTSIAKEKCDFCANDFRPLTVKLHDQGRLTGKA